MPRRNENSGCKLGAVIHGRYGATIWGAVSHLSNDRCEIECDEVFRRTEQVDIHLRGMGKIRARVILVKDGITTVRLLEDSPV